jgi:excisionase family DNA binding protein
MEEGDGNGALLAVACEFLTPRDLAVILNLSTDMVYSLLREGELPAIRLGTGKRQVWRIPQDEFRRYLDTIRTGPRFAAHP